EHLIQQQRNEKHAFSVSKVGNGKDCQARLTRRRVQDLLNIQRFAFQPTGETGRREQVVKGHGEFKAFLGRKERFEVQDANLRQWRRLNLLHQSSDIQIFAGGPLLIENVRDQDVFAALDWIGFNANETEQTSDGSVDPFGHQFIVLTDLFRRGNKRSQNGNRNAGVAARCVDTEVRCVSQSL